MQQVTPEEYNSNDIDDSKTDQEEISGSVDLTKAALLAKELPRPKRTQILSRKAIENRAQNQPTQVPSSPPAGIDPSTKQRQPPKAQNSSKRKREDTEDREKEKEWERQYKSTQKKADKLKILLEHIGPVRSYPEKLNVPTSTEKGRPFPRILFVFDPLFVLASSSASHLRLKQ